MAVVWGVVEEYYTLATLTTLVLVASSPQPLDGDAHQTCLK